MFREGRESGNHKRSSERLVSMEQRALHQCLKRHSDVSAHELSDRKICSHGKWHDFGCESVARNGGEPEKYPTIWWNNKRKIMRSCIWNVACYVTVAPLSMWRPTISKRYQWWITDLLRWSCMQLLVTELWRTCKTNARMWHSWKEVNPLFALVLFWKRVSQWSLLQAIDQSSNHSTTRSQWGFQGPVIFLQDNALTMAINEEQCYTTSRANSTPNDVHCSDDTFHQGQLFFWPKRIKIQLKFKAKAPVIFK